MFEKKYRDYFENVESVNSHFKYIELSTELEQQEFSDFNHTMASGSDKLADEINKSLIEVDLIDLNKDKIFH